MDAQKLTDSVPLQTGGNAYGKMRELGPRVYVAGPYTQGDRDTNLRQHFDVTSRLLTKGYAPYAPLLTHYLAAHEGEAKRDPSDWLSLDLAWLSHAQVLLRTPGASRGADIEVAFCKERGIPVVYSEEELDAFTEVHYGVAH